MTDLIKRDDAPEPCPFCRGKAALYCGTDKHTDADFYLVICDSCDAKGKEYKSNEEAIAAWNTRAQTAINPADRIEQLAATCEQLVKERKAMAMRDAGYDVYAGLEAKLAKAVEALRNLVTRVDDGCFCSEAKIVGAIDDARAALAKLEGETE